MRAILDQGRAADIQAFLADRNLDVAGWDRRQPFVFFLHRTHPDELLPFLLHQLELHHKRYRQAQRDLADRANRLWDSGRDDDADAVASTGLTDGASTPYGRRPGTALSSSISTILTVLS